MTFSLLITVNDLYDLYDLIIDLTLSRLSKGQDQDFAWIAAQ